MEDQSTTIRRSPAVIRHQPPSHRLPFSSSSNVTKCDGLFQAGERVAGRDELLTDVSLVADLDERLHHGLVGDFLLLVELAAAGVARGVDMSNDVSELADPADQVA